MKVNDKWVGWGLGDVDPKVAEIKAFLRRRYASYAGNLNDSPVYTQELADVVSEAQRRLGLPVTGIYDYATQIKTKFLVKAPAILPIFYSVEGHLSNMWAGPVADTGTILEREGRVRHQPIGYQNGDLPFNNQSGEDELARLFFAPVLDNGTPNPVGTKKIVAGFSQGAMVVTDFLIKRLQGTEREGEVLGVLQYGNPSRDKGSVASWSIGQAGPIANYGMEPKLRLELLYANHPFPVLDVYRKGDLFADCEPTVEGMIKRACYQAVARSDFFGDTYSAAAQIAEAFGKPVEYIIGAFEAIFSALGFLIKQGDNPHYSPFNIDGGLNWARSILSK